MIEYGMQLCRSFVVLPSRMLIASQIRYVLTALVVCIGSPRWQLVLKRVQQ